MEILARVADNTIVYSLFIPSSSAATGKLTESPTSRAAFSIACSSETLWNDRVIGNSSQDLHSQQKEEITPLNPLPSVIIAVLER